MHCMCTCMCMCTYMCMCKDSTGIHIRYEVNTPMTIYIAPYVLAFYGQFDPQLPPGFMYVQISYPVPVLHGVDQLTLWLTPCVYVCMIHVLCGWKVWQGAWLHVSGQWSHNDQPIDHKLTAASTFSSYTDRCPWLPVCCPSLPYWDAQQMPLF